MGKQSLDPWELQEERITQAVQESSELIKLQHVFSNRFSSCQRYWTELLAFSWPCMPKSSDGFLTQPSLCLQLLPPTGWFSLSCLYLFIKTPIHLFIFLWWYVFQRHLSNTKQLQAIFQFYTSHWIALVISTSNQSKCQCQFMIHPFV